VYVTRGTVSSFILSEGLNFCIERMPAPGIFRLEDMQHRIGEVVAQAWGPQLRYIMYCYDSKNTQKCT
jgi:hypothetical protein